MTDTFASPNLLFIFGLFLTLGVLGAIVARRARWLPTITAYMLLGIAIGPGGLGLIDTSLLQKSDVLIEVALGLILFKLGCDVQLKHMLRSTTIWRVSMTEALLTFSGIFVAMEFIDTSAIVSALIAAIAISSSPAVLVHMAEETEARGPLIYRAKGLLTLNNVLAFCAFSLFLPFALGKEAFSWIDMIAIPLYRAFGAIGIGFVVAFLMTVIDKLHDKESDHFRFALIIGGITVTLGLASMLEVSSLFAALTLGITTKWLETQRQGLSTIEFGSSSDVFFIVLFVMAGANIHIADLKSVGLIALGLALVRAAAKTVAYLLNRDDSVHTRKAVVAISLMLTPMGALAIGLAQTIQGFSPGIGSKVLPMVFAMVAILETMGPFAVNAGIRLSGESPMYRKAPPPEEPKEPMQAETVPQPAKLESPAPIA